MGTWLAAVRPWSLGCTDAVDEAQNGTGTSPQVLPVFNAPALPTGVTAVNPGALLRILAAVQQIKDSGKCTDAIARELGIVGSEDTGPDLATLQPELDLSIQGGQVFVDWGWGGYAKWLDSCEIWVDRGDGKGFVFLTIDTTPGYTDTQPFPVALAKWSYKAIYRQGDGQAGQWSAVVSVTVPG